MSTLICRSRSLAWVSVISLVLFLARGTVAQTSDEMQQTARLVVVVTSVMPDSAPETSAGIIFGAAANRLYIITPNHTVRHGADVAQQITVESRWAPDQPLKAHLLDTADAALDVAVLSVETTPPPDLLRFDILGNPAAGARGDSLYIIGHPGGKHWVLTMQTNALSGIDGIHLYFQSPFADDGQSGGAIVNDRFQLIGMVRSAQPPRLEAVTLDVILRWLEGNGYAVDLRPPGAAGKLAELESALEYDSAWACGTVSSFGERSVDGAEVQQKLLPLKEKVESDPRYYGAHSFVIGSFYRCLGAAYLIDGKLDLDAKLHAAIPYLTRSLDYYPDQPLLKKNIEFLRTALDNEKVDIRSYTTNVLQVVRGRDEPSIASVVDQVTHYMGDAEYQAQQWLMQDATTPSLGDMMDAVRQMGKQQIKADWSVDVTSKKLPNGLIEVRATVGPNIFLWNVDYARKQFTPANQLTQQFMEMMNNAKK